jgi:hypothetical protein
MTERKGNEMQTKKSQWGNKGIRVSDACPTRAIDWKMGQINVHLAGDQVAAIVREGVRSSKDGRWTPKLIEEAVRYALWVHAENKAEFNAVMGARV